MSGLFRSKILPSLPEIIKKPSEPQAPVKSDPELAPLPPKDAKIVRYPRNNREMALGYETLWKTAVVREQYRGQVAASVKTCRAGEARYRIVAERIHMPWELLAGLHKMECGNNFRGVMHNGELIIGTGKKTRLVPAGRGPFNSWEESCIDAIGVESKRPAGYKFDVANTLYYAEMFNGFGFRGHGVNSAYLWSYTNHYTKGKYVSDHNWDPNAVSKQCGIVPILMGLGWKPETWN